MNKTNVYKGLKTFFYLAGFPLMLLIMLITLMPMFNVEVMGDYAQNWIIAFFAIWAAFEILRFVLNKFVGSKSEAHHRLVLIVTAVVAILAIVLPPVIYDAVQRPDYEAAKKALPNGSVVKDYDAVAGWHRDFTEKYNSEVYWLIDEHYDFMKMYGLQHTYSEWYDNADKEHNLGYKYGSFDWAKKLVKDKLDAAAALPIALAELETVNARYAEELETLAAAQAAFDSDGNNDNKNALDAAKAAVAKTEEDLFRYQGERVVISGVKADLVDALWEVVLYIKANPDKVLPDGLHIGLLPDYDLMNILPVILGAIVGDGGLISKDMLNDLIPDVIYLGTGNTTNVTYLQKLVDGGDGDLSLVAASEFNFKINHYPQALAAGAVKFAAFIGVGLVVLSLFLTDYFSKKEKELKNKAEGGEEND